MLISHRRFWIRTLALALVFAAAGFTYATSTSSRSAGSAADAAPRAVGTTGIRFTNALLNDAADPLPDTFDLGDACFGSTITRYITAVGGLRPYTYSVTGFNNALVPGSSLSLGGAGCLVGSVVQGTGSPLLINVLVIDSYRPAANRLAGSFILNLVTCNANTFRFAVDRINNGSLGLSYVARVQTIGGTQPIRFSVVPNTLTVNGEAKGVGGLEAIGLSLAEDGTIYGRPLVTGAVAFTARAVDANGRIASSRGNAALQDQLITFSISENEVIQTDYTTLAVSVKADNARFNKDSIKFSGNVNVAGIPMSALNGQAFAFRIGGASFEGRFNAQGKVVNQRGGPLVFSDGSIMKASLNSRTGNVSGTITKASVARQLDGLNVLNRTARTYGVGLFLCNGVVAGDFIEFAAKRNKDKFQLTYALGKTGRPLGGAFQLVNTKGEDRTTTAGTDGDQWSARFIAIPRFGIDAGAGTDTFNSATVRIGTNFVTTIPAASLLRKGDTLSFSNKTASGNNITRLQYNLRSFTGDVQSLPLSQLQTGIRPAKTFPLPLPPDNFDPRPPAPIESFTFGFDLNATAGPGLRGEGAKAISPVVRKGLWVDQSNLKK